MCALHINSVILKALNNFEHAILSQVTTYLQVQTALALHVQTLVGTCMFTCNTHMYACTYRHVNMYICTC